MQMRRASCLSGLSTVLTLAIVGSTAVAQTLPGIEQRFVRDLLTSTTQLLGPNSPGQPPAPRFIAFASAEPLVEGDTNGITDVFVRDQVTGAIERVSVDSAGNQTFDEVVDDELLEGGSSGPSISADGRFVAFESEARTLVPGDMNRQRDVFVRDRQAGVTERVSVTTDGTELQDSRGIGRGNALLTPDGRFVLFSGPNNSDSTEIFLRDRLAGTFEQVTMLNFICGGNGCGLGPGYNLTPDGRFVVFQKSEGLFLFSIALIDRQTGVMERIDRPPDVESHDGQSGAPSISADGRFVAYATRNDLQVANDTNFTPNVFVRDRQTGAIVLVDADPAGNPGDGESRDPSISADGRFVTFTSTSTNLVTPPPVPAVLVLTPERAMRTVGTQHCVVAQVSDASGVVLPAVQVGFAVSGRDSLMGSALTDAAGRAEFCFVVSALPGLDTITAATQASMGPMDIARVTIVPPRSTAGSHVRMRADWVGMTIEWVRQPSLTAPWRTREPHGAMARGMHHLRVWRDSRGEARAGLEFQQRISGSVRSAKRRATPISG